MLYSHTKFEIKETNEIISIMLYRSFIRENGDEYLSYIDSFSPMNKNEIGYLKNFLQEYLNNNDWY